MTRSSSSLSLSTKTYHQQLLLSLLIISIAKVSCYSFLPTRSNVQCFTRSSQNIFQKGPSSSIITIRQELTMKVSKGKSKHSKGNTLHVKNQERKRTAGRVGTKHFMDPNKVFVGNLAFDATADDVKQFLRKQLGTLQNVESVKIISDWKTGKSKGYGFVQFMEPMYATSAMELIRNKRLKGRVVRLDQGKKKDSDQDRLLFIKKRQQNSRTGGEDNEADVIDGALDEVEALDETKEQTFGLDDFDDEDDSLFDDDEDDDDDWDEELDGWYEDIYGSNKWEPLSEDEAEGMNREQRREAQRMKPRKKLPAKGFSDV